MSHASVGEWLADVFEKKRSAKPVAIPLRYTSLTCGCRRPLRSELGVAPDPSGIPVWYALRMEDGRTIHKGCGNTILVLRSSQPEPVQPYEHDGDAA